MAAKGIRASLWPPPPQLMTEEQIPRSKTAKDIRDAQVSPQVCVQVCVYLAVIKPFLAFVTS